MSQEDIYGPGSVAKIKVIGVGGAGGNAVNTMIKSSLNEVDFICCNTDVQALKFSLASRKIQIGRELTRGLGAGADPDVGREAAIEDKEEIAKALSGADMVFITAGMGGGTGTGAASVVAQIAREQGALTVAVVTKPFNFEGKRRRRHADAGIQRLRESVDTLITIPNQRLLMLGQDDLSMVDAFKMADAVLVNAVQGISDIINIPGILNVDFADVKTVMSSMGQALMGIGRSTGPKRALEAAKMAICSPLLEDIDIEGATGILINITAGNDVKLSEIRSACEVVQNAAHEDAQIIFGAVIDETLGEELKVTVIATGFPVDKDDGKEEESEIRLRKMAQFRGEFPLSESISPIKSTPVDKDTFALMDADVSQLKDSNIKGLESLQSKANLPLITSDANEVEELALWTFNHSLEESSNDLLPSFEKASDSAPFQDLTQAKNAQPISHLNDSLEENQTLEHRPGVSAITDPVDEFVLSYVSSVTDIIKNKDLNDTILLENSLLDSRDSSSNTPILEGAMSSPLPNSSKGLDDFEDRLIEAFEMNDRIKSIKEQDVSDDLDIPTFLRSSPQIELP